MIRVLKSMLVVAVMMEFFLSADAGAGVLYVDKDNRCPGSGTGSDPFCRIQLAFDRVSAGDTIRIRNSSSPYDENAVATASGTASNPIVVEPDDGHSPVIRFSGKNRLRGAIEIRDADYWTVRNLTFDGRGVQTSDVALYIEAKTRDVRGHRIIGNVFRNWGGDGEADDAHSKSAIWLRNGYTTDWVNHWVRDSLIRGNVFDSNRAYNISLRRTADTVIEDNEIVNTRCGRSYDGTMEAVGIYIIGGSRGVIIRGNTIRDFEAHGECVLRDQGVATWAGIWCDGDADDGTIEENTVFNISQEKTDWSNPYGIDHQSVGIFIESRCDDWSVRKNIVHHIGLYGMKNGSGRTRDPNRTRFVNNTVYAVGHIGLMVERGYTLTIQNNIVSGSRTAQIVFSSRAAQQGPHRIDHNLYYDGAKAGKIGRWGGYDTLSLKDWRADCGCDASSKDTDPMFVSTVPGAEDFHLQPSSPARGAGNKGQDLGAYPSDETAQLKPPSNIRILHID